MPHVGPASPCLVSGPARVVRRLVARAISHGGLLGVGFQPLPPARPPLSPGGFPPPPFCGSCGLGSGAEVDSGGEGQ
eukprot:1935221-Pyramimonas_sp.AAC.1